jgi:hypothetical protein
LKAKFMLTRSTMKKNCLSIFAVITTALLMAVTTTQLKAQDGPVSDTIIYNFVDSSGSFSPNGPLIKSPYNEFFYGTTPGDTFTYKGSIFEWNPTTDTETLIYSVPNGSATPLDVPEGSIAFDGNGDIFVASAGTSLIGEGGGSIWELVYNKTAGTYTEQTLFTFAGAALVSPQGGLVIDSAGNLYGSASSGGNTTACSNGCGGVWELAKSGSGYSTTLTVLHTFDGTDGSAPVSPLTLSTFIDYIDKPQIHLLGTTRSGGSSTNCTNGCGTVYELSLAVAGDPVKFSTLHSFVGTDGSTPVGSLYYANNGLVILGLTSAGGSSGDGVAYEIYGPADTMNVIHNFTGGTTDGNTPLGNFLGDANGNLYATTSSGGNNTSSQLGTVVKFTYNSSTGAYTESLLYSFQGGTTDGSVPTGSLSLDGNVIYGTTQLSGTDNGGVIFTMPE